MYIGIDIGTSDTKAAIFDHEGKEIANSRSRTHVIQPQKGWYEMDGEVLWQTVIKTVREVMELAALAPSDIKGIGISAVMMGVWALDKEGILLRNPILWNDARAQSEIDKLLVKNPNLFADIFVYSGSVMQTGCILPVLLWMKNYEPDILTQTHHVICAKDYIRYRLTGEIDTDFSESSIAPGNARTGGFEPDVFELLEITELQDKLATPKASTERAGELTVKAADVLGLKAATPVAIGAGDVVACVIGAGGIDKDHAVTVLGTTLMCGMTRDVYDFAPENLGLTFRLPEDKLFRTMVNIAGTTVIDWCLDALTPDIKDDPAPLEALGAIANSIPKGANGVRFVPYLSDIGIIFPRIEPRARAQFYGLNATSTRADMVRAIYEGLAFAIRENFESLEAKASKIHLVGGGARSDFWAQLIADICQKEVVRLKGEQFGAKGAAICAMLAVGAYCDMREVATNCFHAERSFSPDPSCARLYDQAYADFRILSQSYLDALQ